MGRAGWLTGNGLALAIHNRPNGLVVSMPHGTWYSEIKFVRETVAGVICNYKRIIADNGPC